MNIVGIGTDIVECLKIAKMIERHGELFLARVFTPHEMEFCSSRKAATQHYTSNWAAKEAVLKALGTVLGPATHWRDIEVRQEPGAQPKIRLGGRARELCEQKQVCQILVSISHCRTHATAYALALGNDVEGGSGS